MTISDEAVETAAEAWHLSRWPEAPWDMLNDESRNYGRTHIRAALEAAAPHMLAQAWDEGADSGYELALLEGPASDYVAKKNPHLAPACLTTPLTEATK